MNIIDTYYLVDYENVGSNGLSGCQNRTASDHILIFFIQNIGLWGIPTLIGWVLDTYCVVGTSGNANEYDYTIPMCIFTGLAILSLFVAFLLKVVDKKKGYGLELPNIKK